MSFNNKLHKYAEVLVKIGLELREDQPVCIEAPVEQSEFVAILAQEAYLAGASKVGIIWKCDRLERVRLDNQPIEVLDCDKATADYYAGIGAGFIRLDSPDFTTFAGVSAEKINEKAIADSAVRALFRQKAPASGSTIACMPSQGWADMVFPDLPEDERLSALWEAVFQCVRINEADPVSAWKKYIADTGRRKALLDSKQYQAFHYLSAKTDLTIKPIDNQMWVGGCMETSDGRVFVPNIPTEEVFTTPHKYSANGYVASTLPLNYRGQLIDNFVLGLENGKIVNYTAEKGEELLGAIINTDSGSCYLGEMALIDQASPIASLNRTFYTTLYDENASCHIAIGMAYGPPDPELKEKLGINDSKLHVDFMLGSDDMHISGQRADGSWEDVFVNGHWAI